MGINIPTREELIINQIPKRRLATHLGADSVEYLTVEGLVKAVEKARVKPEDISREGKEEEEANNGENDAVDRGGDELGQKGDVSLIELALNKKNGSHGVAGNENDKKLCGMKIEGGHCTACLTGNYPIPPQAFADQF